MVALKQSSAVTRMTKDRDYWHALGELFNACTSSDELRDGMRYNHPTNDLIWGRLCNDIITEDGWFGPGRYHVYTELLDQQRWWPDFSDIMTACVLIDIVRKAYKDDKITTHVWQNNQPDMSGRPRPMNWCVRGVGGTNSTSELESLIMALENLQEAKRRAAERDLEL